MEGCVALHADGVEREQRKKSSEPSLKMWAEQSVRHLLRDLNCIGR
jgi:hypothetical protein